MKFLTTQLNALYALYNATGGIDWNWRSTGAVWNFTDPNVNPCVELWQGVDCGYSNDSEVIGLALGSYGLFGTLPLDFFNISSLLYLNLTSNFLTGTIPDSIVKFERLENLSLSRNNFYGQIPSAVSSLVNLVELQINDNSIFGTIPDVNNSQLSFVDFSSNFLIGTLPLWNGVSELKSLNLSSNKLSGCLPSWTDKAMLEVIVLNNNLFSSLPVWTNMNSLLELDISYNMLSGPLPSLSSMIKLQQIILNNNKLTGNLNSFAVQFSSQLRSVELSNNQFSGSIPSSVFVEWLEYFSIGSNCLSGTLPSELCDARNLTTINLNGASSASACQHRIFPSDRVKAYINKKSMHGTVPVCIFGLPQISFLALAGLSLQGELPNEFAISDNLETLSLANNRIMGDLPLTLQIHDWVSLNLFGNKFKGTLTDNYPVIADNSTVSMYSNRLSGYLPRSIIDAKYIQILESNSFDCNLAKSDLPSHDPQYTNYHNCGSQSFNDTLTAWASIIFVSLVALAMLYRVKANSMVRCVCMWYNCAWSVHAVHDLGNLLYLVTLWFTTVTIFLVVVMIPFYVVISHFNATQTEKYFWIVTLAYSSGYPLGIGILVMIFIISIISLGFVFHVMKRFSIQEQKSALAQSSNAAVAALIGFIVADIAFASIVNVFYVYAALNSGNTVVQIAQVAVSFFKLGWNNIIVRWGISYLVRLIASFSDQKVSLTYSLFLCSLETAIVLFNNIISPFFATLFVSSVCFYNIFVTPPDLAETNTLTTASGTVIVTTSFLPAFNYSYQCSSSYITTYAPVYMYMFITISFLSPLMQLGFVVLESRIAMESNLTKLVLLLQPKYLQSLSLLRYNESKLATDTKSCVERLFTRIVKNRRLFQGDVFVVRLINMIVILLTFGAAVPIVAVTGVCAIISFSVFTVCGLGRFISAVNDSTNEEDKAYITRLEDDCRFIPECFVSCSKVIVPFLYLFYPIILVDVIGDTYGFDASLWFIAVPFGLPILVWLGWKWWRSYQGRTESTARTKSTSGFELQNAKEVSEASVNPLGPMEEGPPN